MNKSFCLWILKVKIVCFFWFFFLKSKLFVTLKTHKLTSIILTSNMTVLRFHKFSRGSINDLVKSHSFKGYVNPWTMALLVQFIIRYIVFQWTFDFVYRLNNKIQENCCSTNIDETTQYTEELALSSEYKLTFKINNILSPSLHDSF